MKHLKLFEQFINEAKKFSDAFSVLDFFGGALPNDYNKAHAAAKKAGYDLPTSLYDEAAMMAQDGENENLHENTNDVITIKDVDIDFTLGGTTDLKQQIAKDEKKFKIKVKPTGKSYNVATFAYDLIGKKKDLLNFLQNDEGMGWDDEETKEFYPELYEGRIALNHVYANAPVRNKILEILRNGRVAEQDFMNAVSKAGAPTKWISRNSHFFKVEEEDGVKYYSLTKSGHVIMSALNESEVLEIYEEFGLEENLIVDPLDLTQDFFYVSINGKVYGYQAKPGGNIEDVATTFKKMLKYSAGKALAWLKKNTELALGAGGSGPLRESKDAFIDFMMKEMSWNGPEITQIEKGSKDADFLKKSIGVKDGWSEAYEYRCYPGSSVITDLKNAAKKFGKTAEVKRGFETSTRAPYHDYFIIFR